MKKAAAIVAAVATVLVGRGHANAQWAVFDASNFGQTLATAVNTARQVQQLVQQIEMMKTSLGYQLQNLKTLDPTSFDGVLNMYDQSRLTYSVLTSQVDSLKFSVQEVDGQFNKLFPKKAGWRSVRSSDMNGMHDAWQGEITGSSQTAMRAQTNLAKVQQMDEAATKILVASQAADGQVRQLQGITQMLGVVQTQLASLIQTTTTLSRVLTGVAAAGAGEKQLTAERKRRRTEGYTQKGPPPAKLNRLP